MSTRAWIGFAALGTLWGIPYLFIKIAVDDGVPPAFLAWVRVALAAAVLLALAARARTLGTVAGRGRWIVAYALIEISVPFPFIAWGEQRVASSLAAIVIACVPLIVAVLAIRFDHDERVTGSRLVGLFIGLGGVVALVGIDVAGDARELAGVGAVLIAAVGYAVGPMLLKSKLTGCDPRAVMGASLAAATVVLAPFALADTPATVPSVDGLVSLVVLGLGCTALAFVLLFGLVSEIGPSRALVITYVNPVVAVALGVAVLDERPGAGAIAGLLLIIAGSWLSTGGGAPPRRFTLRRPAPSTELLAADR